MLEHLRDLAAVAALLLLGAGIGGRFLRRGDGALGLLEELAVGLAALALSLLGLGAVGLLRPLPIALLLLGWAALARPALAFLPARIRECAPTLETPLERAAAAIGGLIALFLLAGALAPTVDWDSLMYHLDVPAEWLAAGRIHLPSDNLHVAHVGLVHLLYVPLLAFASPAAPAVLSAAFALLLGVTVAAGTARFAGRPSAAMAVTLLWGTGMLLLVAISPRVDVTVAFFLTLAHVACVRAMREDNPDQLLVRASLLLGCAGGIKYHALAFGAALFPLMVWTLFRRVPRARRGRVAALAVCAAALPTTPWLLKNWLLLGAPLYPFGSAPLLEPWLAELYRGAPDPDPAVFRLSREVRSAFTPLLALTRPDLLSVEGEATFYSLSPAMLLLPLWVWHRKDAALNAMILPGLLYVGLVLIPSNATNLRYFLPAVPPLTIAAAMLASATVRKLRLSPVPAAWAAAALLLAGLWPGARVVVLGTTRTAAVPHALGFASARYYLDTHWDIAARTLAPARRLVETRVPADGRVLLLFEARGFGFPRPVLQDNRIATWPLLAPRIGAGCLEGLGVSHLLLNTGALGYYRRRGLDPARLQWPAFETFAARCLTPVGWSAGFILFKVNAQS